MCLCDLRGHNAIYGLRGSAQGMDMLRKLSGATWTHWMPHPGHRFLGVRASLQKHAEEQIAEYAWHARCRERPSLSWQSLVTRELRRTTCRLHGHGLSCHKPLAIMTVRGTIDISDALLQTPQA